MPIHTAYSKGSRFASRLYEAIIHGPSCLAAPITTQARSPATPRIGG